MAPRPRTLCAVRYDVDTSRGDGIVSLVILSRLPKGRMKRLEHEPESEEETLSFLTFQTFTMIVWRVWGDESQGTFHIYRIWSTPKKATGPRAATFEYMGQWQEGSTRTPRQNIVKDAGVLISPQLRRWIEFVVHDPIVAARMC